MPNGCVEDFVSSAWRRVRSDAHDPVAIITLKDLGYPRKKSIYRLCGAGPDGSDVVAKRARRQKTAVELAVYDELLCRIPLRTPAFYGLVKEQNSSFWWLFLEHIGGDAFRSDCDDHRALSDEWLSRMHVAARGLRRPAELRQSGLAHYLAVLRAGRKDIRRALLNGGVPDQRPLLDGIAVLDRVEARWAEVERLCVGLPETLTHGDFVEKNLVVADPETLVPFDWASASWGIPATDVMHGDACRYQASLQAWPEVTVGAVERTARAGRFFWHISAIRAAARDYASARSQRKFADHVRHLGDLHQKE